MSHGSVATQLRCDGIFNNHMPLKELLKSVNIWQIYGEKFGGIGTPLVGTQRGHNSGLPECCTELQSDFEH